MLRNISKQLKTLERIKRNEKKKFFSVPEITGFTGFYRELPGFTGDYRRLPVFTGALPGSVQAWENTVNKQ
mgnify:FL=1